MIALPQMPLFSITLFWYLIWQMLPEMMAVIPCHSTNRLNTMKHHYMTLPHKIHFLTKLTCQSTQVSDYKQKEKIEKKKRINDLLTFLLFWGPLLSLMNLCPLLLQWIETTDIQPSFKPSLSAHLSNPELCQGYNKKCCKTASHKISWVQEPNPRFPQQDLHK